MRYICIHGHFYQPPRENPYLEALELQDSAYPYHDWNERITAECYAPNATSRIMDAEGRILNLVNNYSQISFNFGPTLLSWLESNAPKVYEAIREFERRFGRRPEGMWLPETAVDTEALEVLAENGITFTILAPRQANRVRL